jgi:hypothetical protein
LKDGVTIETLGMTISANRDSSRGNRIVESRRR